MMYFPDKRTAEAFARPLKAQVKEHKFRFYVVEANDPWPPLDTVNGVEAGQDAAKKVALNHPDPTTSIPKKKTSKISELVANNIVDITLAEITEAAKKLKAMKPPTEAASVLPWLNDEGADVLTDAQKLVAVTNTDSVKKAIEVATGKPCPPMTPHDTLKLDWSFKTDTGEHHYTFKLAYKDVFPFDVAPVWAHPAASNTYQTPSTTTYIPPPLPYLTSTSTWSPTTAGNYNLWPSGS